VKRIFLLATLLWWGAGAAYAQIQSIPVDQASANRGAQLFAQSCAQCHGADARGTTHAPDLIRSLVVLHDRAQQLHGSEMAAVLKEQPHNFDLPAEQLADLSQFLTRAINGILRSGYSNRPTDMLSGDSKAGEVFFNGAGGCTKCHSATGDLAGIATRYDPAALQQRFVFPESGIGRGRGASSTAPKTKVTVTLSSGKSVAGTLVHIDDFNVTLLDSSGERQTLTREPGMKVDVSDPYAAHVALLDKYQNADIHNLTAYLETLK
jgi:mono/diheme cytochrome c family protein/small nuclear ribonucleoprotein (snRNP)-like protein